MAVQSFDLGFVSPTDALVDFYKTVLELEEIEPRVFPIGVVRRLACGGGERFDGSESRRGVSTAR
ncbi:MAG TPA: hypothetical protein VFC99_13690 [Acidimicrobiia bacterium]|nr:hypothetical protein [Acidimicrobiia bacterium]